MGIEEFYQPQDSDSASWGQWLRESSDELLLSSEADQIVVPVWDDCTPF